MLADALVLAGRMPQGASVVDVGTGAGAPGLALAIARPDLKVTLIEPLAKRVSFLRTVLGTIARSDVVLERVRGEDLVKKGASFDVAVSRATLAPGVWLGLGCSLVKKSSSVWVLLAKEEAPFLAGAHVSEDVAYEWPFTKAGRRAVRYVKD
jgi:16S rRNA (guanine527-N7)-methyltransferase